MQETWVQFLGWDEPLEEGMATHSSTLAWRIPMDRGAWWATFHGVAKSRTQLSIPGNGIEYEGARGKEGNILKLYILFVLFL